MTELTGYKKLTPTAVAGAATRCSRTCLPTKAGVSATQWSAGWVIGWPGGLPRVLRGRRPGRHRHRRRLPRRTEPAYQRRVRDHQRDRGRLRRRSAVPVPPPRVHGRRLRTRRRRDQRAVGGAGVRGRVEPDDHQGDRRHRAATDRDPRTGQYSLDASGALVFRRAALDWHQLQNESEAFFLRIYGPGDYRWKGADLGVLVTKGRLQVESGGGKSH